METLVSEKVQGADTDELRIGKASWDSDARSIKYTWFDKNGHACRGGELPITALPQVISFAVREGFLSVKSVLLALVSAVD